jgi:hypothetical protein
MNAVPTVLHRFMNKQTGMTTTLLDRLAKVLDLRVVVGSKPEHGRSSKRIAQSEQATDPGDGAL